MKLKFTGTRYVGTIAFTGPGEKYIGKEVTQIEAERLSKDFPDRFSIVDDTPSKKEMKPKTTREMKPKQTK